MEIYKQHNNISTPHLQASTGSCHFQFLITLSSFGDSIYPRCFLIINTGLLLKVLHNPSVAINQPLYNQIQARRGKALKRVADLGGGLKQIADRGGGR